MKTSEVLKAAKARIATPETWTQDVFAKDNEGCEIMGYSRFAVCFCSIGAIQAVTSKGRDFGAEYYLNRQTYGNIAKFNDSHTHEEVMAAWDRAIAAAEADEAAVHAS